jgi:hypothetical protein
VDLNNSNLGPAMSLQGHELTWRNACVTLAVETEIAPRPPHGAVLAQFMHTALTLSNGRQSEYLAKGAGCAAWGDSRQRASPFAPT